MSKESGWLKQEVQRARARIAQIPRQARPIVTKGSFATKTEIDPTSPTGDSV